MKLYSGPISLFTAKVRIALAEKGLPYERVEVGYSLQNAYLPHHSDVARLNPKGEVPVLVDGELVAYDSTIILEYLEDRYPDRALYPTNPADRARCRQLEAFGDEILFPDLWTLIEEVIYGGKTDSPDLRQIADAQKNISEHHSHLDRQFRKGDYLVREFSVADITNFIFVNAAAMLGAPVGDGFARLETWLERVAERPAVKAEIAAMQEFLQKSQSDTQGESPRQPPAKPHQGAE
jgi:glutathione S-transferase